LDKGVAMLKMEDLALQKEQRREKNRGKQGFCKREEEGVLTL